MSLTRGQELMLKLGEIYDQEGELCREDALFEVKCFQPIDGKWQESHVSYSTDNPAEALRVEQRLRRQARELGIAAMHFVHPYPEVCLNGDNIAVLRRA